MRIMRKQIRQQPTLLTDLYFILYKRYCKLLLLQQDANHSALAFVDDTSQSLA